MMSQEALNKLAYEYACSRAKADPFCGTGPTPGLGDLDRCVCLNDAYTATISSQGVTPVLWSIQSGMLPPGLDLDSTTGAITGTTTTAGTYDFSVRAYTANGAFGQRDYSISVLEVTTTSLPNYVIGAPYSVQLTAFGGSGSYAWSVTSGELPEGMTLSSTGLLSGTPTTVGTNPLVIKVIDQTCEAIDDSFYSPAARLYTQSTTTVYGRHGWRAYGGIDNSILYKRLDVSGYHEQIIKTSPLIVPTSIGLEFAGGARYTYAGASIVDVNGNISQRHTKVLNVACTKKPYPAAYTFVEAGGGDYYTTIPGLYTAQGYCWDTDPNSCTSCNDDSTTWSSIGDYATTSSTDLPTDILIDPDLFTQTSTSFTYSGLYNEYFIKLDGTINYPTGSLNVGETVAAWTRLYSDGNFTLTLSDEFTAADSEAGKVVYTGSGGVAENTPISSTWVSNYIHHTLGRQTSVNFRIHYTDLVAGKQYIGSYELTNTVNGYKTTVSTTFTAAASTHDLIGSIGVPAAGQKIKISKPTISKL